MRGARLARGFGRLTADEEQQQLKNAPYSEMRDWESRSVALEGSTNGRGGGNPARGAAKPRVSPAFFLMGILFFAIHIRRINTLRLPPVYYCYALVYFAYLSRMKNHDPNWTKLDQYDKPTRSDARDAAQPHTRTPNRPYRIMGGHKRRQVMSDRLYDGPFLSLLFLPRPPAQRSGQATDSPPLWCRF